MSKFKFEITLISILRLENALVPKLPFEIIMIRQEVRRQPANPRTFQKDTRYCARSLKIRTSSSSIQTRLTM